MMWRKWMSKPASAPPTQVPISEIGAYPQSEWPFPAMGRIWWAIREPRSRAGFMLVPVGPAIEMMIAQTSAPTRNGVSDPATAPDLATRETMETATNTRVKVGTISAIKLFRTLGIAGWLQKQASLCQGSGVSAQRGRDCSQTNTEPPNPPSICAAKYGKTLE